MSDQDPYEILPAGTWVQLLGLEWGLMQNQTLKVLPPDADPNREENEVSLSIDRDDPDRPGYYLDPLKKESYSVLEEWEVELLVPTDEDYEVQEDWEPNSLQGPASEDRIQDVAATVAKSFGSLASSLRPDHYDFNGVRPIDIARYLPFPEGNVIKYVARAGRKDPSKRIEDLEKALRYLKWAIENAQAEQ